VKLFLPVSESAMKSRFFSLVRSEINLYFFGSQNRCNSKKKILSLFFSFVSNWCFTILLFARYGMRGNKQIFIAFS
jgi:hypothetical protein